MHSAARRRSHVSSSTRARSSSSARRVTMDINTVTKTTLFGVAFRNYFIFGGDGRATHGYYGTVTRNDYEGKIVPFGDKYPVVVALTGPVDLLKDIVDAALVEYGLQTITTFTQLRDIIYNSASQYAQADSSFGIAIGACIGQEVPGFHVVEKSMNGNVVYTENAVNYVTLGSGGRYLPDLSVGTRYFELVQQTWIDVENYVFRKIQAAAVRDWGSGGNIYTVVVFTNGTWSRLFRKPLNYGKCLSEYGNPLPWNWN